MTNNNPSRPIQALAFDLVQLPFPENTKTKDFFSKVKNRLASLDTNANGVIAIDDFGGDQTKFIHALADAFAYPEGTPVPDPNDPLPHQPDPLYKEWEDKFTSAYYLTRESKYMHSTFDKFAANKPNPRQGVEIKDHSSGSGTNPSGTLVFDATAWKNAGGRDGILQMKKNFSNYQAWIQGFAFALKYNGLMNRNQTYTGDESTDYSNLWDVNRNELSGGDQIFQGVLTALVEDNKFMRQFLATDINPIKQARCEGSDCPTKEVIDFSKAPFQIVKN